MVDRILDQTPRFRTAAPKHAGHRFLYDRDLAAVQFRDPIVLAVVGLAMWVLVSIWGYAYNKWQRDKEVSSTLS